MTGLRLALAAAVALGSLFGCGGSGGDGEVKPFLVTFVPAAGDVASVNLRRANEVYVEDRFFAGDSFDSFAAAPPRSDALAIDSDTGTLAVVDLGNLSRIGLAAAIPAAVSFAPAGAVASAAGAFFLVHDETGATLAAVDASDRASPTLSAEAELEGGAAEFTADPRGAFVLLSGSEPGAVGFFDFGTPAAPLRIEAIAGEGPISRAEFVPHSDDLVAALDESGAALVLISVAGARTGAPLESTSLVLPLEKGDGPVAWAGYHAAPRLVVAGSSGRLVIVDVTDPLAPVVLRSFESGADSDALALEVAPDDSLLAVAARDTGALRFFSLASEGDPALVGAFALGGALEPIGFAPDDDALAFARRPLFYAGVAGAELVLADLSAGIGAVLLSPAAAFTPLRSPAVYSTKRGAVLVGLDGSGRVVRFGLYDPDRGPELITSADLGLGASAELVHLYFRQS